VPQEAKPSPVDVVVELQGVEGAFEISEDGFLLRSVQSCTEDPEEVAAAIASVMKLWKHIGTQLRLGTLKWILLEFREGKMIVAGYGNRMLVVFGSPRMVDGEVLMNLQSVSGTLKRDL
jgi:predicted regulator of Ras-like GTPase activity (Roadblock/LC7/MglB family)